MMFKYSSIKLGNLLFDRKFTNLYMITQIVFVMEKIREFVVKKLRLVL
jgi:hypothetical protein